jgi:ABC-2 type transport system ATP-binding protein
LKGVSTALPSPLTASPLIEVAAFSKRYGRHTAVGDLSFSVPAGGLFGLLGSNGAGKTTTIRALVGLTRPSAGQVRVAGHDVWRDPIAAKLAFGYIPDRPHLYGKLTGRETLRFVAGLRKLQGAEREIDRWLEYFRLEQFGNELTETYSHGMRQKLVIITALLPRPRVLIVDEPMVGLDPHAARQVRELLRAHADTGNAVLLTTHSLPLAEAVCDRLVVLDRGKVLGMGSMDELRAQTGTAAGGTAGDSLERVFFRLIEEEQAQVAAQAAQPEAVQAGG